MGTQHRVLAGFDDFRERLKAKVSSVLPPASDRPAVDIYNPAYGQLPLATAKDINRFSTLTRYGYGTYFQNQITFFGMLHEPFCRIGSIYDTEGVCKNHLVQSSKVGIGISHGLFQAAIV